MDLDMVIFYATSVKTLGLFLPEGSGISAMNQICASCMKVMKTEIGKMSALQHVAACSYLSSISQVRPHNTYIYVAGHPKTNLK